MLQYRQIQRKGLLKKWKISRVQLLIKRECFKTCRDKPIVAERQSTHQKALKFYSISLPMQERLLRIPEKSSINIGQMSYCKIVFGNVKGLNKVDF
jgi:hypothetical protein